MVFQKIIQENYRKNVLPQSDYFRHYCFGDKRDFVIWRLSSLFSLHKSKTIVLFVLPIDSVQNSEHTVHTFRTEIRNIELLVRHSGSVADYRGTITVFWSFSILPRPGDQFVTNKRFFPLGLLIRLFSDIFFSIHLTRFAELGGILRVRSTIAKRAPSVSIQSRAGETIKTKTHITRSTRRSRGSKITRWFISDSPRSPGRTNRRRRRVPTFLGDSKQLREFGVKKKKKKKRTRRGKKHASYGRS